MKEKFQKVMEKLLKLADAKLIRIISNGFLGIAALSICGALFSILRSFPIPAYQDFIINSGLDAILAIPSVITADVISLYVAASIAYSLAKEYDQKNPFGIALVALGAFFVLTPFTAPNIVYSEAGVEVVYVVNALGTGVTGALGSRGIFLAAICGLVASRLFVFLSDKKIKIKMPESVPQNVTNMFEMMLPGGIVFTLFLVLRWIFSLTSFGTAQDFIYAMLQAPLMLIGGGTAAVVIYYIVNRILWLFGIHGGMVLYSAMAVIIRAADAANLSAFANREPIPHVAWSLLHLIGDLTFLPIVLSIFIFCKSKRYRTLGKLSLAPAFFNISEPLVFGMPIVMNPIMALPWVLMTPINLLLTLGVMNIGLVSFPTGVQIVPMIPSFIGLALMNSSWTGVVWVLILIALNIFAFMPFLRILDKKELALEKSAPAEESLPESDAISK